MELLKMLDISKSFFGVKVLNKINFNVEQGEVHALLGENGAGKSTLMNILGGVYTKDSGKVIFDKNELNNISVRSAEQCGIAFVHQELNLFNDLKVYENLFLQKELITKFHMLRKKEMIKKTQELFDKLGVNIDPTAIVSSLDTSKKQLLEIAKSLFAEAKLFILDEPTTALNNTEIEHLFGIINKLKELGKTFIFISHKMPEIFTIADRYTILRNGEIVAVGKISDVTAETITRQMVGESYSNQEIYELRSLGEPVLQLNNLCGQYFSNINLELKKGEVLCFTGLQGSGSSELLQAIFGSISIKSGEIILNNNKITTPNIHKMMRGQVAMVPANRKENSVFADLTLLENGYIAEHTLSGKEFHISRKTEKNKYDNLKQILNIKATSHNDFLPSLSGGNQQKIILARWLNTRAEIFLFDNPTQGIDVGAKAEIYKLILALAKQGKTVIVNTLEIPEIQKIADRCAVFYHGNISKILDRFEIKEHTVMLYATNAVTMEEKNV